MRVVELPQPDATVHPVGADHSGRVARAQLRLLRHCGLTPASHIMEIGCGIGRLVYELGPFLDRGSYAGFDISPEAIAWLRENYAPLLPNFRFDLVEVFNARYNRDARAAARSAHLPYGDDTFDFSCSFSVFTHMQLPDIAHYLSELRRVLTPGGRGVMTFFSITDRDIAPRIKKEQSFVEISDGIYTTHPRVPERALAFRQDLIEQAVADAKLSIIELIEGGWHRHGTELAKHVIHKDVFVLTPA